MNKAPEITQWGILFKRVILIIRAHKKKYELADRGWNSYYKNYTIKQNDIIGKPSRRRICCGERMVSLRQNGGITKQWFCYTCHKLAMNSIAEI